MTTSAAPPRPSPHWLVAFAGTALAYLAAAWASGLLSIPATYGSPLAPAAGIALACVLTYGWRMVPAVALASFTCCLLSGTFHALVGSGPVVLPAVIAIGSALQAALGAALMRRFLPQPMRLSEPRDVAIFCALGAAAAALTTSSVTVAALALMQAQSVQTLFLTWWIWATGDTLGVLIATPVVLTLIGRPRSEWVPRRTTVGLTLTVATALIAFSIKKVDQWEEARVQAAFERDAIHVAANLDAQLQFPLHALEATRGVFISSESVTRDEHRRATEDWLQPEKNLRLMGWAELIKRSGIPAYEARASNDFPAYKVFDSPAPTPTAPEEDITMPIRYVEPSAGNSVILGLNARSTDEARQAIDETIRTDRPAATPGFRLAGDPVDQISVLIYQAVYDGASRKPQNSSPQAASGVVFVALQLQDIIRSFQQTQPAHLTLCLFDADTEALHRRLAGPPSCESTQGATLSYDRPMGFANRTWVLRVQASRTGMPDARASNALLFSLIGLVATTMLAALLLTVTGRTRRIETAVKERTLALQREISERERTEAELRESEQRFRNILNNVPIGVVYTDLRGNIKQVNPRFCDLTGYDSAELAEMNLSRIHHPEDRVHDLELTGQLIRGGIPMYRRQGRYITRDGRLVWVQSTVTLLRTPTGEPHRIVGVVEDITEHLRLAEAERARTVAEAANLAKSEFLSRMSHELRTPLNAMLGFAQLLELDHKHPLAPSQQPWVGQIQSAGWHLLDMINDVLDLSRIESGTLNLQIRTLDLRDVLASTLALIEQDARRRSIVITQEIPEGTTRVMGDATRVKQILTNVLSNAVKYNSDGGRIHIATRAATEGIDITITDTGMGMTTEQLAQLFQPFNRLGRERSSLEGTGIGLVVSQRLADLMGGSLNARSVAGEGSSFILNLPLAELVPAPQLQVQPSATQTPEYHQRVVHYVEDNETNVEVMRGVLSRRPQVRLDISVTGLEGLAAIRAQPPDLILLDMHLPDIDGLELLRHLKSDDATADIPVVAVSADALASQIKAALDAGAQQYLTKPISVAELLSVVDSALDEAETRYG